VRSGLAEALPDLIAREEERWLNGEDKDEMFDSSDEEDDMSDSSEDGNDMSENSDEENEDDDEDEEEVDDRPEWEKVGEKEGRIHYSQQEEFATEVRAYQELQSIQGDGIPRFLSTVTLDMPSTQPDLPATYFQVPGILIEKLENCFVLEDLFKEIPTADPLIWQEIVQQAVDIAT
jgi:hypothetical protein